MTLINFGGSCQISRASFSAALRHSFKMPCVKLTLGMCSCVYLSHLTRTCVWTHVQARAGASKVCGCNSAYDAIHFNVFWRSPWSTSAMDELERVAHHSLNFEPLRGPGMKGQLSWACPSQHTVNTRSTRGQHTVNTQST